MCIPLSIGPIVEKKAERSKLARGRGVYFNLVGAMRSPGVDKRPRWERCSPPECDDISLGSIVPPCSWCGYDANAPWESRTRSSPLAGWSPSRRPVSALASGTPLPLRPSTARPWPGPAPGRWFGASRGVRFPPGVLPPDSPAVGNCGLRLRNRPTGRLVESPKGTWQVKPAPSVAGLQQSQKRLPEISETRVFRLSFIQSYHSYKKGGALGCSFSSR